MWKLRIEQYFQVQDHALWDVIKNGNSFNPVPRTTANADGTFTSIVPSPVTTEEKAQKKNNVKARSMLLMALPNEHLLTFSQYKNAKTLFEAIQARCGGNDAIKKTQKTLFKQMYESFNAPSTESLDSIFNKRFPAKWNTHIVVWRNKADLDTISFDDLYNNFKIVEQEVKRAVNSSSSSGSQNMAFLSSPGSTNEVDTANIQVSTITTPVSTLSTHDNTANMCDATVFAFLANQPNGSQLVHEDLEQIHEDDLEEMDLKWQLALLSMRVRRYFQRTGKKITINGSDTAGYDKTKVECFNCHKMRHFARECRSHRNQESKARNQDSSRKTVNVEDTSSKAMVAIDGAGMIRATWLMMKLQPTWLLWISQTQRGLASVEEQLVFYKKNKVVFCDQIAVLKRDASFKDSEFNALNLQPEKLKIEKESNQIKIDNFENASKSLDKLIGSQITDTSRTDTLNEITTAPDALIIKDWVFDSDKDESEEMETSPISHIIKNMMEDLLLLQAILKEICDKKNSVLFTKTECLILSSDFKLPDEVKFSWVFFLPKKDETSGILKDIIGIENQLNHKVKIIRCDNRTEFKNYEMNQFCGIKVIKREFSNAMTQQQNEVAERKNRTLIEAAKTMVLVTKPHNKTHYELLIGRPHIISFMRPFGCPITILNTLDHLGKFDGKANEGFLVKAFRVYNSRTRKVEENLHVNFLENKPNIIGSGPEWLFDIDSLTNSMNYQPVSAGKRTNGNAGSEITSDAGQAGKGKVPDQEYILLPLLNTCLGVPSSHEEDESSPKDDADKKSTAELTCVEGGKIDDLRCLDQQIKSTDDSENTNSINSFNTASLTVNASSNKDGTFQRTIDTGIFDDAYDDRDEGAEANYNNLEIVIPMEPKKITRALDDESWRGIDVRNKARLVAQGHRQEEGIDYDKVFTHVARIEAIRLFLAYTSFMDFTVYQMDVKSAFLYGTIEEEVYVSQPLGFVDPEFPNRVYKVEKDLHGHHQAPRAWLSIEKMAYFSVRTNILKKFGYSSVKTASTSMETHKPLSKDADGTYVDVHLYRSIIGSLMYLTSSRPYIMFVVYACSRFQVQPKVSHMHAVKRIFRYLKGQPTLGLWYPKDSPSELIAYSNSDYAGASLDRKSTTGGCQFLGSRLISWQCKKQTIMANSITEVEYIVASNCCRQVLWLQNQLLDYGYNFMQTKIHMDNESSICVVKNHVYHSKTKHIEIMHHFIRDSYEKRLIEMVKVHTDHNVTDLLTKAFDVTRFQFLIASIGLELKGYLLNFGYADLVQHADKKELAIPGQTATGKEFSNPLMADEAVHNEESDRVERAITTDASLEAAQDSANILKTQTTAMPNVDIPQGMDTSDSPKCQETIGGTSAQTRSERVLEQPSEPPLTESHTSRSGEGRMEHPFELADTIPPTPHDSPLTIIEEMDKDEDVNLVSKQGEVQKTVEPSKDDDNATLTKTLLNIKRSLAKDKGKGIMQETELPKKLKKKEMIQLSPDEELAQKLYAEELAKQAASQEQERRFSKTEVKKNMVMYLKNQGGYKQSYFKGMKYEDIWPIFERVWDQVHTFVPKDSEIEKEVIKKAGFDL
nr:putative ribonuclease H-like domain-containing protein [Tanacetum cinerariifolium]